MSKRTIFILASAAIVFGLLFIAAESEAIFDKSGMNEVKTQSASQNER